MSVSSRDDNNLDMYLNNLFHAQVEFNLNDEEVQMVQTGIEGMVKDIVHTIERETCRVREELSRAFLEKYPGHESICGGNSTGGNIVKAGSFYEGTKNGYPDEFDFIYLLGTFKAVKTDESYWRQKYFIFTKFHDVIRDIATTLVIRNVYFTSEYGPRLVFNSYDRHEGPASKFKFEYWNASNEIAYIYVDIVPAFKIIDRKIHLQMGYECFAKDFVKEVKATGSYLITEEVSFTPTELFFIRTILSDKHRTAYRIVKYLFNGNRNGNVLYSHKHYTGITSYVVKVAMINHHCACKNPNEKVSNCVIGVIELLQNLCIHYQEGNEQVVIRKLNGGLFDFRLNDINTTANHIRKLLMKLELMKVLDLPLNIKPMSNLIVYDMEARHTTGTRRSTRSQVSSVKSHMSTAVSFQYSITPRVADASSRCSSIFNWEDDLTSMAFRALVSDRDDVVSMRRFNMPKDKSRSNATPKINILNPDVFQEPDIDEISTVSSEKQAGNPRIVYYTLSPDSFPANMFETVEEGISRISTKPSSNTGCCMIM